MNMDIALLQPRFYTGGRSRVAAEIVRILNEFGMLPDLVSYSTPENIESFEDSYNLEEDENFNVQSARGHKLMKNVNRGVSYQIPILSISSKINCSDYDLIINLGNCAYFLPEEVEKIHYIHHPPEAVLNYEPKYNSNRLWNLYTTPLKLLYWTQTPPKDDVYLANSEYTKDKINEFYDLDRDPSVVYPPVVDDLLNRESLEKTSKVATLGAFHPNKKQLDQIDIAQSNQDYEFIIMGRVKSEAYFKKCKQKVSDQKLNNVELLPNVGNSRLFSELESSNYFLHTRKNERFGIAVVEAISRGCIPIVHDSGGSEEIVPISQLRYENVDEVSDLLQQIEENDDEWRNQTSKKLTDNAKNFTPPVFQNKIKKILKQKLKK